MSNTELWDKLGRTDPKHTKGFSRAGGFKGTALKPMWAYHRMTEEFGACGVGWGINAPTFQTVATTEGEVLVYCTVSIWHGVKENIVHGVGGDKAVSKRKDGAMFSDDEAFKKSFTDAITNALKLIGVGADIHMGLFDDAKYVQEVAKEFEPPDEVEDSRIRYIEACNEQILNAIDPVALRDWWNAHKQVRRDFDLSKPEVDALVARVTTKLKALDTAAKAA